MTEQRHRIRRQVVEVTVPDVSAAWPLQGALGRVLARHQGGILERCFSALCPPDRVLRIESLELDLGRLDPDDLERDLIERLGSALSAALAERLRADDAAAAGRAEAPEVQPRLELLALFARTGALPWWVDTAQPRQVDEAVGYLLQHAAGPLTRLTRALAVEGGALRRVVLHCSDDRLAALFDELLSSARPALASRDGEELEVLRGVLRARPSLPGGGGAGWRASVWTGALRAAGDARGVGGRVELWQEALALTALEAQGTYDAIVTSLSQVREGSAALAALTRALLAPLRGEQAADAAEPPVAGGTTLADEVIQAARRLLEEAIAARAITVMPRGDASDAAAVDAEGAQGPERQAGRDRALADLLTAIREATQESPVPWAGQLLQALQDVSARAAVSEGPVPLALVSSLRTLGQRVAAQGLSLPVLRRWLGELTQERGNATADQEPALAMAGAAALAQEIALLLKQLEALERLERLERLAGPLAGLLAAVREALHSSSLPLSDQALEALRGLDARAVTDEPAVAEAAALLLRCLESATQGLSAPVMIRCLEMLQRHQVASRPRAAAFAAEVRARSTSAPAAQSENQDQDASFDAAYGDSDEAYVENAGLVVLWPFFARLLERLELMVEGRFRDPGARHRAAGLMHFLASGEIDPAEYQLSLAKVLCGLAPAEVFEFGPPVTDAEAEECTNLLEAAIASAPILGEMSVAGFRASFLLRRGALSARDGGWLLRVERAAHDVVLDRFPWAVSLVKLAWMDAPLGVEW